MKAPDTARNIPDRRNMMVSRPPLQCEPMTDPDFQQKLQEALDTGTVLRLDRDITLEHPVEVRINVSQQRWHGLDGNMHTIVSRVVGYPAIKVIMDDATPKGTCDRSLVFKDFTLVGSGQEQSGLVLDFAVADSWIVNPLLQNLWFEGLGGRAGLEIIGSIFEGNLYSVGTMNCINNGVYLANAGGGIVSALRWFGGTQRQNGGHGILVDAYDGPYDVRMMGLYLCENRGNGIHMLAGCESIVDCGFENNHGGAGIYLTNRGKLATCTASTYGPQPFLIQAYVVGNLSLINCSVEAYGGGSIQLLKLDGGGGTITLMNSPGGVEGGGADVKTMQTS